MRHNVNHFGVTSASRSLDRASAEQATITNRRQPTVAYICDGCGKRVETSAHDFFTACRELNKVARGWLVTANQEWAGRAWPWSTGITACSADCVLAAKEAVKQQAMEALLSFADKIDHVVLKKIG